MVSRDMTTQFRRYNCFAPHKPMWFPLIREIPPMCANFPEWVQTTLVCGVRKDYSAEIVCVVMSLDTTHSVLIPVIRQVSQLNQHLFEEKDQLCLQWKHPIGHILVKNEFGISISYILVKNSAMKINCCKRVRQNPHLQN